MAVCLHRNSPNETKSQLHTRPPPSTRRGNLRPWLGRVALGYPEQLRSALVDRRSALNRLMTSRRGESPRIAVDKERPEEPADSSVVGFAAKFPSAEHEQASTPILGLARQRHGPDPTEL